MVETKAVSDGLARRGLRVAGLAGESRVGGSGLLCLSAASDRVVGAALIFLWVENYPYLKGGCRRMGLATRVPCWIRTRPGARGLGAAD